MDISKFVNNNFQLKYLALKVEIKYVKQYNGLFSFFDFQNDTFLPTCSTGESIT